MMVVIQQRKAKISLRTKRLLQMITKTKGLKAKVEMILIGSSHRKINEDQNLKEQEEHLAMVALKGGTVHPVAGLVSRDQKAHRTQDQAEVICIIEETFGLVAAMKFGRVMSYGPNWNSAIFFADASRVVHVHNPLKSADLARLAVLHSSVVYLVRHVKPKI
ncbi:uncharacterized protein Dwil_GK13393 [Drosophila willistoni]|uniref:Uncharacterized protein n=1 Tax=Drosophila willistoni TaxID=7260 RepID=A0A0Q9WUW6_DROWI|nr:uncharacterized protein Dwil_GK13393 [Drosophila willistoni]